MIDPYQFSDRDQKPIRINRDPILSAEPDPGSSDKIDPWMFSTGSAQPPQARPRHTRIPTGSARKDHR